jgi:hypothetical protein
VLVVHWRTEPSAHALGYFLPVLRTYRYGFRNGDADIATPFHVGQCQDAPLTRLPAVREAGV